MLWKKLKATLLTQDIFEKPNAQYDAYLVNDLANFFL